MPADYDAYQFAGSLAASSAGGVLAVSLSPPMTKREAFIRVFASMTTGFFATPLIVEYLAIDPHMMHKVLAINAAVGFVAWFALTVAIAWLEKLSADAKSGGPGWLLAWIRGKGIPIPPEQKPEDRK